MERITFRNIDKNFFNFLVILDCKGRYFDLMRQIFYIFQGKSLYLNK